MEPTTLRHDRYTVSIEINRTQMIQFFKFEHMKMYRNSLIKSSHQEKNID